MITPTVGRVVWFYHSRNGDDELSQPFAAIIAYVWSDRMINIGYFDHNGGARTATSVNLLQDDDEAPVSGMYARWMPYQKGQAAKYEALEAATQVQPS